MPINYDKLKNIYQTKFDELLNQLGKNCKFVFQQTISNVENDFADLSRPRGIRRPNHQTNDITQNSPTKVENSEIIKCLVEWDPKQNTDLNIRVEEPMSIIKLKTSIIHSDDILRCQYMIPNIDSANRVEVRYRLLKQINPRGLKEDRYIVSYWKQIHNG